MWKHLASKLSLAFVLVTLNVQFSYAQSESTDESPAAILQKRAPNGSVSREDAKEYWLARYLAAKELANVDVILDTLPKLAEYTDDAQGRSRLYWDTVDFFKASKNRDVEMRTHRMALNDEKLPHGDRAWHALTLTWFSPENSEIERLLGITKRQIELITPDEGVENPQDLITELAVLKGWYLTHFTGESAGALKALETADALLWNNFATEKDSGRWHGVVQKWIGNSNRYVQMLIQGNRPVQALNQAKATFEIAPSVFMGKDLANAFNSYATALSGNGQYEKALEINQKILEICRGSGAPFNDFNCNHARRIHAYILMAMNRMSEAQPSVEYIIEARNKSKIAADDIEPKEIEILRLAAGGSWLRARFATSERISANSVYRSPEHGQTKQMVSMQMLLKLRDPSYVLTKGDAASFLSYYIAPTQKGNAVLQRGIFFENAVFGEIMQRIVEGSGRLGNDDATDLAFALAEHRFSGVSASALLGGSAKLAAIDPELRDLVEREQALKASVETKRKIQSNDANDSSSSDQTPAQRIQNQRNLFADAEQQLTAEEAKLQALHLQITQRFPIYEELSNPKIPTAKKLASQLKPNEAYVALYSGTQAGAAMVVDASGKITLRKVQQNAAELRDVVGQMRAPFDAVRVPTTSGNWAGFNPQAAHALYQKWLEPLAAELKDVQTIHIATDGFLANVPWEATLMEPATSLSNAHWTGDKWSMVRTPGAASVVLNRLVASRIASKSFIAFADPRFSKTLVSKGLVSANTVRSTFTRALDDSFEYSQINALPETLEEAHAAARALGADPITDVVSGAAATRSRVLSEPLMDRQLIEFATHGVLPGQIPGLTKPALAMAYEGEGTKDSLLTVDDIVGLKLNADWILLSACNTGLTEVGSTESLSAMSRAFFAAGAKSVLATQWAVESASAKQLVVSTLTHYSGTGSGLGKAQALSLAQRDMASGKYGALFRHPYFWSAYFLTGEPSR
jgi:CHAT domain-containing protein